MGEVSRHPKQADRDRARQCAVAAVRGELRRLLERRAAGPPGTAIRHGHRPADPVRGLATVAFRAGQFMAASGFAEDAILADLLRVAAGLGAEPAAVRAPLAQALAAGRALPWRVLP